jgi:rhodanese-related sulfurtransferase
MPKIFASLLLLGFVWGAAAQGADGGTMTLEEFRRFVESGTGVVLDARGAKYFAKSHVPGAINLPVRDFDRAWEAVRPRLRPEQPVVVYCSSLHCPDSAKLRDRLVKLGYRRVEVFKGGLAAWWKAGLPLEKSAE